MSTIVAVLGASRLTAPLFDHGAPFGDIVPIRGDHPEARAAIIDLPPAERPAAAAAQLAAGRIVLCPPMAARTRDELARLRAAGGVLLPGGEIAHSETGRRGLAAMADPAFGTLKTLYLAIRQPRATTGDVVEDLLPEALDFVQAAIPGRFESVRVNAAALFGPARDSAVVLLRAATGAFVTVEVARCLPPTLPAPGLGEIEIDAMGTGASLRILPNADAVRIHADAAIRHAPWLDAAAIAMLRAAAAAPAGADGHARAEGLLDLMEAIRAKA